MMMMSNWLPTQQLLHSAVVNSTKESTAFKCHQLKTSVSSVKETPSGG